MKKIALTILSATFIVGLFSIDTTTPVQKTDNISTAETVFRSRILGQAGQISNPDFNFKKENPISENSNTAAIPGRDELIKLSNEIREKTAKIKNLKFDPVFIKDEKFRNLVELEINLEEPSPVGVKNPFLDFKFRNQVSPKNLKNNTEKVKPDGIKKVETETINNVDQSPLFAFVQCITGTKTKLYISENSPKSDEQLALFEEYDTDLTIVNCTNVDKKTNSKSPYKSECTDKKITVFPSWEFPKSKIVTGVKDLKYLGKATGCVLKS